MSTHPFGVSPPPVGAPIPGASVPQWNYDLKAAPKKKPISLLYAQRVLDDDDMPTGAIVGWTVYQGERDHEAIDDASDWSVPELDHVPGGEYFGDDYEVAQLPTAWCAIPDYPPVPGANPDELAPWREPVTSEGDTTP